MTPYATAAECKALSALSEVAAKTDPQIDALIVRAELIVDAWTKQNFRVVTKTLRVTGSGSQILILPERLAVLTSVKFLDLDDGGSIILSSEEIKDIFNRNWHLIAEPNFATPRARFEFGRFPDQEDNIEITGDWGYSTVPDAVKNATCFVVEKLVVNETNKAAIGGAFKSERIGDYRYERFDVGDQSTSDEVARLLPTEARLLLRGFHRPLKINTP